MRVIKAGLKAGVQRALQTIGGVEADRALYLTLAELRRRRLETGVEASALTAYELRAFSQNGEDGVLAEIFRRISVTNRFFIEFGIESGREGNCVYLADVEGWDGLFIEADPALFAELQTKYRATPAITTTCARVMTGNVERLFADAGAPLEPDLLSIDIDGQDYWIWEAIRAYTPRVVVIEYSSLLDPARRLVMPQSGSGWDGTTYTGASLGALEALAAAKGYRLVHTELAGLNAFFVRAELAEGLFPDNRHVPRRAQPNYFLGGFQHPPDPANRAFVDLDRA